MILPNRIYPSTRRFILQPAPAWGAILGFIIFSALITLVGAGGIVRLFFPAGAFAVSLFLYRRYPILYLGFIWWVWFLTPWFRRFVDYRGGVSEANVTIMLAPLLATLVCIMTSIQYLPKYLNREGLPYILLLFSSLYGLLVGLAHAQFGDLSYINILTGHDVVDDLSVNSVILGYLYLVVPIFLSFHIFANWRFFPQYQMNIQCVFRWGVLVTGVYGVVQFLVAPEWDRLWLNNITNTSFGVPEPLGIRVFSTMNAPGPYAQFLSAGLILLLADNKFSAFASSVAGYLAFLLTLVRTFWGSWFLSLLVYASSLKLKSAIRLFFTAILLIMFVYSLTIVGPASEMIGDRLITLSDVQSDGSFQARVGTYSDLISFILSQPIGFGLGLSTLDSGFLYIFLSFGWLGGILFMTGLSMVLFNVFNKEKPFYSLFINATSAIVLGFFPTLLFGNTIGGLGGCLFWCFAGITLAGNKYYQNRYHHEILKR